MSPRLVRALGTSPLPCPAGPPLRPGRVTASVDDPRSAGELCGLAGLFGDGKGNGGLTAPMPPAMRVVSPRTLTAASPRSFHQDRFQGAVHQLGIDGLQEESQLLLQAPLPCRLVAAAGRYIVGTPRECRTLAELFHECEAVHTGHGQIKKDTDAALRGLDLASSQPPAKCNPDRDKERA